MKRARPEGFTLLEAVLALAILVGSLTIVGELADMGLNSARHAAALAEAQLLCETKLAEILAGVVPLGPMVAAPLEDDPHWTYSVQIDSTTDDGLLAVRVTVVENLPPERRPTEFTLVRWMPDPNLATASTATETAP